MHYLRMRLGGNAAEPSMVRLRFLSLTSASGASLSVVKSRMKWLFWKLVNRPSDIHICR